MFSVTVAEASTKLGVSPARVRQLIKSGILAAEQVAGIWLIDEKSVEARREHNPGRGRPSARLSQPNASHYLLMNRDHEVLAFRFDASTGEFLDADEIIDAKRAPLSIMSRGERRPPGWHFPTGGPIEPSPKHATASRQNWPNSASPTRTIFPSRAWASRFPTSIGSSPTAAKFAGAISITSRTISPRRRWRNGWPT